MRRKILTSVVASAAVLCAATACSGGGSDSGADTIKIAYQRWGAGRTMDHFLKGVKKQFEQANKGTKVKLLPIVASENDYYTKIQLMMRSPRTAPDIVYEDTFLINSDIEAGYLRPLDQYLSEWSDWSKFQDTAKEAARAQDGKIYGVPDGTDTRALWYNVKIFEKVGLPVPWHPKTWADLLSAARTIKKKAPGVVPFNIYGGKAAGEASSMQGFEMLLYGTENTLYDKSKKKWVVGSQGFKDSLRFLDTVYSEGLGPKPQKALNKQIVNIVADNWMPNGKVAINLDGSWLPGHWMKNGGHPWPEWPKVLDQAPMPTQHGQAPGKVSLSGGWTWAIPQKSDNPDMAWKLIKTMTNKKNNLEYVTTAANIAVRKDVAKDPRYLKSQPSVEFFTSLVPITQYRPALPPYPKVSNAIQVAMEAVMTNQASVEEAAKQYDQSVTGIVGEEKTTRP